MINAERPGLSSSFTEWIAAAHYSVFFDNERVSVENSGGEIRYHVERAGERFIVRRAERSEADEFIVDAGSMTLVERYLTKMIGGSLRSRRDLPAIRIPSADSDIAAGYRFILYPDGRKGLRRNCGDLVDVHFRDTYSAVQFSYYADADLAHLRRSYDAPDGAPLFMPFVIS